jgi:hypothetical protein
MDYAAVSRFGERLEKDVRLKSTVSKVEKVIVEC